MEVDISLEVNISKIKGFSLIEVLVSLLLLSLGIGFSAQWLIQSIKLHSLATHSTQITLLAANIAEGIRANENPADLKHYWEKQLKFIHPKAELSIARHDPVTHIIITIPLPQLTTLKWVVVSG